MYRIVVRKQANKVLNKLDKRYKERVMRAIWFLGRDPYLGKPLYGEFYGKYSLRVWPYRILYEIYKDQLIVKVVSVGHRQGVYG
jgi:mRNA interferase RelE/StbE